MLWALAGPGLAAEKPKPKDSLIRQGYGNFGGTEVGVDNDQDFAPPSTSLVPDASVPGGYRFDLQEPGVTSLPGQSPSVIPDPYAPGGYRYQPGVMSDPDAPPGQLPRVVPDANSPGGYRITPQPSEAGLYAQPTPPDQSVATSPPPQQPATGLLPQFRWPGDDPDYRQRQEQPRQPEANAPNQRQRYPWEPYQDRRSLRYRDQRQQAQEQEQDQGQGQRRD